MPEALTARRYQLYRPGIFSGHSVQQFQRSKRESGSVHPGASPMPNDRLDSWKEIATHLTRSVRTVQRWERWEGLPVHRHLHKRSSSVYASKSELSAWWGQEAVPAKTAAFPDSGKGFPISAAVSCGSSVAIQQTALEVATSEGLKKRQPCVPDFGEMMICLVQEGIDLAIPLFRIPMRKDSRRNKSTSATRDVNGSCRLLPLA